jgi:hypothetical protein
MSAIKYNNTTSDMSNAYGLSVYFPYRSTRYVNMALEVYDEIDMDQDYANCVRTFATYTGSGQVAGNGGGSAYNSFNGYDTSGYANMTSEEFLYNLLEQFVAGYYDDYSWYDRTKTAEIAKYLSKNHFDADLNWKDGKITLTKEQWALVDTLRLNLFIDDGSGYIELGKDAIYTIDENGSLLKPEDMTWLAASIDNENWQLVPYYHLYQTEYDDLTTYMGRIPVLYNGEYANLITLLSDEEFEVIGILMDYREEVDVVAKTLTELSEGDEIEFVCDYYDYDGNYDSSHILGDKIVIKDDLYLGDVELKDYTLLASYEFKDIYQEAYYSSAIK